MSIRNRLLAAFAAGFTIPMLILHGTLGLLPHNRGYAIAVTVLALGGLYTFLSYRAVRMITMPLLTLKKASEAMTNGDFGYELPANGRGEIGELVSAFQNMRDKAVTSIARMRQMEENKKQLLANISHDLRTPITSIQVHIAALEDGLADTPDKQAKYLSIIKSKLADMNTLAESLFLFSKLDLQSEPFTFQSVPLDLFLQDVVEEWQFRFPPASVQIILETTPNIVVSLDGDKFKRVVVNILDNAANYSGMCPLNILICMRTDPESVVLNITDQGAGVPPEIIDHLFNQFYRSPAPDKPQSPGSGLGLSIARQIVLAHGGTIRAVQEPGISFTVEITLPIRKGGTPDEKDTDN